MVEDEKLDVQFSSSFFLSALRDVMSPVSEVLKQEPFTTSFVGDGTSLRETKKGGSPQLDSLPEIADR